MYSFLYRTPLTCTRKKCVRGGGGLKKVRWVHKCTTPKMHERKKKRENTVTMCSVLSSLFVRSRVAKTCAYAGSGGGLAKALLHAGKTEQGATLALLE